MFAGFFPQESGFPQRVFLLSVVCFFSCYLGERERERERESESESERESERKRERE